MAMPCQVGINYMGDTGPPDNFRLAKQIQAQAVYRALPPPSPIVSDLSNDAGFPGVAPTASWCQALGQDPIDCGPCGTDESAWQSAWPSPVQRHNGQAQ